MLPYARSRKVISDPNSRLFQQMLPGLHTRFLQSLGHFRFIHLMTVPTPFLAHRLATWCLWTKPAALWTVPSPTALLIFPPPWHLMWLWSFVDHPDVLETGSHPLPLCLCAYPPHQLTQRRGPHTCSPRSFACNAPDCIRPTPFRTKQALNRHYELVHLGQRIDCPVPGCEIVGGKGIKRYDNLVVHVRNVHGDYELVDHEGSAWLIRRIIEWYSVEDRALVVFVSRAQGAT